MQYHVYQMSLVSLGGPGAGDVHPGPAAVPQGERGQVEEAVPADRRRHSAHDRQAAGVCVCLVCVCVCVQRCWWVGVRACAPAGAFASVRVCACICACVYLCVAKCLPSRCRSSVSWSRGTDLLCRRHETERVSCVSPDPPGLPRGPGRAEHPLRDRGPFLPSARRHAAEEHVHHPRYHGVTHTTTSTQYAHRPHLH